MVTVDGAPLLPEVAQALSRLSVEARQAGFELRVASGFRDFDRQLAIWNAKFRGQRPVLDDDDQIVDLAALSDEDKVHRILRFSALPGASRHHWGTDLDVYDAAAVPEDYRVQLTAAEAADDGPFGPLHRWLDERISRAASYGFYRPYDRDRGGVAPERWHLSYAPLSHALEQRLDAEALRASWCHGCPGDALAGRACLEACLDELFERYVSRVARPDPAMIAYALQV